MITSRSLIVQYEADSAPAIAIQATIERTEKRFANYSKAGLLCGSDGLPHLISDPGLAVRYGHAGETLVSTFVPITLPVSVCSLVHASSPAKPAWITVQRGVGVVQCLGLSKQLTA